MNDLRMIREKPDVMREALMRRQMDPAPVDTVLSLDEQRRTSRTELENLQAKRNALSKEIGRMKDDRAREEKKDEVRQINARIAELEALVNEIEAKLQSALYELPNIPDSDVPTGRDENDNVVVKQVGEPRRMEFDPLPHWDLGPRLGWLDFERGVKLAGSRFYVLSGGGAKLQRALIQWLLDLHLKQGYHEQYPPFLVKEEIMLGAGQLPKFRDNLYHDVERDAWLVPTAEVPLTGLHFDEILDGQKLPLNYTAYTPCFRKEPLAAGKDTRGIKRGFQFDKVELYMFTLPEESDKALEKMTSDIEETLALLELPFRVKKLCTGDLGFASAKTFDFEVWAPGVQEWLEVSSASNVRDFQARRSNIRARRAPGAKPEFVHTLNGSALGIPRTMIGIIENYQQADGSVAVPRVLRPYVNAEVLR